MTLSDEEMNFFAIRGAQLIVPIESSHARA